MSTLTTPKHECSQTSTSLVETWGGKAALACTDTEVVRPPSFSSLSIHWFYSNINGSLNHPWCIVIFHAHLFGVPQFNNNAGEPARQKIINLEGIMNTCTVQTYFSAITNSSQQSLYSITSQFSMFIHVLASSLALFGMPFDQPQLVISQTLTATQLNDSASPSGSFTSHRPLSESWRQSLEHFESRKARFRYVKNKILKTFVSNVIWIYTATLFFYSCLFFCWEKGKGGILKVEVGLLIRSWRTELNTEHCHSVSKWDPS